MERIGLEPRPDWRRKVEERGLSWHTGEDGEPYWDESAYWRFTEAEIDRLEAAIETLYGMVLETVDRTLSQGRLDALGYDAIQIGLIEDSWARRAEQPSLYGRFDLAYDGDQLKLLEFNGDTPTSLVEAAVVQWWWLEERFPHLDQFNSIHERLVAAMGRWSGALTGRPLHLTCLRPHAEDDGTVEYLAACAAEAGLTPKVLGLHEIGWRSGDAASRFVDQEDADITWLFKLAPWEWLLEDRFGPRLAEAVLARHINLVEPAWKMLASDKQLLWLMWELWPGHPLLLPATLSRETAEGWRAYVRKPARGREGAKVAIFEGAVACARGDAGYAEGPFVYQVRAQLAQTRAGYAVLGGWVAEDQPAGLGVRESVGPITSNTARFLPHLFSG